MKIKFLVLAIALAFAAVGSANVLIVGSGSSDSSRYTWEERSDAGALLLDGILSIGRSNHCTVSLKNGDLFLAGGNDDSTSWQIMSQNGNILSSGNLLDQRVSAACTLLDNGNVFIAGGLDSPGTWEIRSASGGLVSYGALLDARTPGASAVSLSDGNIWISGAKATDLGSAGTYEIHNVNGHVQCTAATRHPSTG